MTSTYCSVEDVTEIASVNKNYFFRNDEDQDAKFEELITKWIELASDTINTYCNRKFEADIPGTIRLATALMVSNLIAFAQTRKETPIIKKDDWTVDFIGVKFFTDDIKEMLAPYDVSHVNPQRIQVYTISGDDCGES